MAALHARCAPSPQHQRVYARPYPAKTGVKTPLWTRYGERVGVRGLPRSRWAARHPLLRQPMQLNPIDLVGRRQRQLVHEPDEARVYIGRRIGERELLDAVLARRVA